MVSEPKKKIVVGETHIWGIDTELDNQVIREVMGWKESTYVDWEESTYDSWELWKSDGVYEAPINPLQALKCGWDPFCPSADMNAVLRMIYVIEADGLFEEYKSYLKELGWEHPLLAHTKDHCKAALHVVRTYPDRRKHTIDKATKIVEIQELEKLLEKKISVELTPEEYKAQQERLQKYMKQPMRLRRSSGQTWVRTE